MSARDDLAQLLADDWNPNRDQVLTAMFRDYASSILAAGWRPPARTIATESDLTVADYGTVITDAEGRICEVDGSWLSGHICLDVIGQDEQMCGDELTWPATVFGKADVVSEYRRLYED